MKLSQKITLPDPSRLRFFSATGASIRTSLGTDHRCLGAAAVGTLVFSVDWLVRFDSVP